MTFKLTCGDVMPGCTARFECTTEDLLLAQVAEHAAHEHQIATITPEIRRAVLDRVVVTE